MTDRPNIFDLIREGRMDEFIRVVTEAFRQGAAEGHRQSVTVKAAMVRFGGDNAKALEFLRRPLDQFDGKTAFEWAGASDEGLSQVLELIRQSTDRDL